MPPKKTQAAHRSKSSVDEKKDVDMKQTNGTKEEIRKKSDAAVKKPAPNTSKRKDPPTKSEKPKDNKTRRVSRRGASDPSPKQVLNFLLSAEALPLCFPHDDLDFDGKTYSQTSPKDFSPFEHLLVASLLSKPLSHRLGFRSIRTLLNPPYSLNTSKAISDAGEHRVWEALEDARTQHRQKTASYIFQMAQTFKDDDLSLIQAKAEDERLDLVQKAVIDNVKGMGRAGSEIFARRVQCLDDWGKGGIYPYTDSKAMDALKELGMDVASVEALEDFMEDELEWEKASIMGIDGNIGKNGDDKVAFVMLLERAIGCLLEGNVEEVKQRAKDLDHLV